MANEALERAMEFLVARDWKAAHEIVQKDKSTLAAWLHGIVHTIEGDLDNARYWYRHAEREFPGQQDPAERIARCVGLDPGHAPDQGVVGDDRRVDERRVHP